MFIRKRSTMPAPCYLNDDNDKNEENDNEVEGNDDDDEDEIDEDRDSRSEWDFFCLYLTIKSMQTYTISHALIMPMCFMYLQSYLYFAKNRSSNTPTFTNNNENCLGSTL